MPGIVMPKKIEGDIPDFVEFSPETGEIEFFVPKDKVCIQFSSGLDQTQDKDTGKDIFIIWWKIFNKGNVPTLFKRGVTCIHKVYFKPKNDKLKIYARGAEYYPDHFAFGFAYELPD